MMLVMVDYDGGMIEIKLGNVQPHHHYHHHHHHHRRHHSISSKQNLKLAFHSKIYICVAIKALLFIFLRSENGHIIPKVVSKVGHFG